jgi:mono/diheme cytochrome c family protein
MRVRRSSLALLFAVLSPAAARADAASVAPLGVGGIAAVGGQAVYQHVCQGCHMPGGTGAVGAAAFPAFAGNPKLASPQYPAYIVLNGYGGMPWFNGALSDTQIADVVNYIRTHFGNHWTNNLTAAAVAKMRGPVPISEQ